MNGGLDAVSVGKPSERMSNFWTVWFLKTESEQNFGFPHIPNDEAVGLRLLSNESAQFEAN